MSLLEMPALQDQLRSKSQALEDLVAVSPEIVDGTAWYGSLEDAVLDLFNSLPQGGAYGYEVAQLFYYLTELRRHLGEGTTVEGLGHMTELTSLKLGDVVRRLERRLEQDAIQEPGQAAAAIFRQLGGLDAADLSRLLGVSTKTLAIWRKGGRVQQNKDRVRLVAQLVLMLRSSMTPTGVMMWFDDESDALGGANPLSLVASGEARAWSLLLTYARGGRGQLAD